MAHSSRPLIFAAVLVVGGPLAYAFSLGAADEVSPADATPADPAAPTFNLVYTGGTGSELNIGVTSNGHIFVGTWDAIRRSRDDGATWQRLPSEVGGNTASFAADRVLIVDKDTDRIIKGDTMALAGCSLMSWSDNDGATWEASRPACSATVTDHEKIAVGKRTALADPTGMLYPNILYMCANSLLVTGCAASADGGLTFLPVTPHGTGCAFQGAPVSDVNGVLYEPTHNCGGQIRMTANNGFTWSTISLGLPISGDTPDMAVTPNGALYFFYTTAAWTPALARSLDGGDTWESFDVPVAGLTSSVFPVIVSGDDGRVALAFYGTTDNAGGWDRNPGSAPGDVRWHAYVAIVTDAEAASPTIAPVQLTPASDPLRFGCVSKLGGCGGNPIADYMDIDVGPDGRVYAVWVDTCPAGCANAAASDEQLPMVAVQTSGDDLVD